MVKIRRAQLSDIQDIYEIETLTSATAWSKDAIERDVKNADVKNLVFVSTSDDKVIGYIDIRLCLDESELNNIAVIKEYRQMGIGKQLLKEAMHEIAKKGIKKIYLEVRKSNNCAISLYEGHGFQIYGERKSYYQDNGEDAVLMKKDLLGNNR